MNHDVIYWKRLLGRFPNTASNIGNGVDKLDQVVQTLPKYLLIASCDRSKAK